MCLPTTTNAAYQLLHVRAPYDVLCGHGFRVTALGFHVYPDGPISRIRRSRARLGGRGYPALVRARIPPILDWTTPLDEAMSISAKPGLAAGPDNTSTARAAAGVRWEPPRSGGCGGVGLTRRAGVGGGGARAPGVSPRRWGSSRWRCSRRLPQAAHTVRSMPVRASSSSLTLSKLKRSV